MSVLSIQLDNGAIPWITSLDFNAECLGSLVRPSSLRFPDAFFSFGLSKKPRFISTGSKAIGEWNLKVLLY